MDIQRARLIGGVVSIMLSLTLLGLASYIEGKVINF